MTETLKAFLARMSPDSPGRKYPNNAYVTYPGFRSLYVRFTQHWINGERVRNVLDLSAATASKPGNGAFTRLVQRLHKKGYPLFAESVLNPRMPGKLLRLGFKPVRDYPGCFFLDPHDPIPLQ